jgi:hypothetical protein
MLQNYKELIVWQKVIRTMFIALIDLLEKKTLESLILRIQFEGE